MKCLSYSFITTVLYYTSCTLGYDLTIMHTNHIHAHFEEFDSNGLTCSEDESTYNECFGGIARRLTKVNEIRAEQTNPILLDGGDHFQGTQWFTYYKGNASAHFMNRIEYDAMAPSNHEFDYGTFVLADFLKKVEFPVVSCNIDITETPELDGLFTDSVILNIGGDDVGIVGYTTTRTHLISAPGDFQITDEITALKIEVEKLTNQGINKIIALGTSGLDKEMEIAREVPGIDVIIGADHHHFLYTGVPPTNAEDVTGPYPTVVRPNNNEIVLIVQTINYGKYLGLLQLTFDDDGKITNYEGNPVLLDSSVEQDPETLTEVEEWAVPVRALGEVVVGSTYALLDGENPTCRAGECNLGSFIADALLSEHIEFQGDDGWSDVSISMINSGAIRASISPGLVVTYDVTQPVGSRVVSVMVRCALCEIPRYEKLETERIYKIVMPSYLAEGGDGFDMIPEHLLSRISGRQDSDVINEYLTKLSPIAPGVEGRIIIIGDESSSTILTTSSMLLVTFATIVCQIIF
ncbi:5'-nucleotidase-like isoform X2 [Apostichopus japonicus]|uniref:5'-nucleotidase-like isoform X2 n=1 Tax=Stichopus japonicus TaxID=307972 RepID=UPI003AB1F447